MIPQQFRDLLAKKAQADKAGHEAQRVLMEKLDVVHIYRYSGPDKADYPELKFGFHKLELPDALRILAKLPDKMMANIDDAAPAPTGPEVVRESVQQSTETTLSVKPLEEAPKNIELTLTEEAQYMDAVCEGLALASVEGYTKSDFGKMTPPQFPTTLLGEAFAFVMHQCQMTKKQMENLDFFRRKP